MSLGEKAEVLPQSNFTTQIEHPKPQVDVQNCILLAYAIRKLRYEEDDNIMSHKLM